MMLLRDGKCTCVCLIYIRVMMELLDKMVTVIKCGRFNLALLWFTMNRLDFKVVNELSLEIILFWLNFLRSMFHSFFSYFSVTFGYE